MRRRSVMFISCELMCDRMIHLCRDSFFTGASYGGFDLGWILGNLSWSAVDQRASLAVKERALYAVEDFLLSRHHMFLMVYYHQRSVIYEEMLQRYFAQGGDGYRLPSNVEDYATFDDAHLWTHLRASQNPWARRLIEARPYRMLLERSDASAQDELDAAAAKIEAAGLPFIRTDSGKAISNYTGGQSLPSDSIYVLGSGRRGRSGPAKPLHDVADVFRRYAEMRNVRRLYVPDIAMDDAAVLVDELLA